MSCGLAFKHAHSNTPSGGYGVAGGQPDDKKLSSLLNNWQKEAGFEGQDCSILAATVDGKDAPITICRGPNGEITWAGPQNCPVCGSFMRKGPDGQPECPTPQKHKNGEDAAQVLRNTWGFVPTEAEDFLKQPLSEDAPEHQRGMHQLLKNWKEFMQKLPQDGQPVTDIEGLNKVREEIANAVKDITSGCQSVRAAANQIAPPVNLSDDQTWEAV